MEYLTNICSICWQKHEKLFELSNETEDNLTFYEKLISSVNEMNYEEFLPQFLACQYCCHEINQIYNFNTKCRASKTLFLDFLLYIKKIKSNEKLSETNKNYKISRKLEGIISTVADETQLDSVESYNEVIDFHDTVKCIIADDDSKLLHESQEEYGEEVEYIRMEFLSDDEHRSGDEVDTDLHFDNDINFQREEDEAFEIIHIKEEHENFDRNLPLQTNNFICPNCGQICIDQTSLDSHISKFHLKRKRIGPSVGNFKCTKCTKRFKKKILLLKHLKRHDSEPKFKCEICSKTFWRNFALEKHKKLHENGENEVENFKIEVYACKYCDKTFKKRSYLRVHVERHAGKNQFQCEFCFKIYSDRSNLHRHRALHITGPQTFVCQVCNRVFNRKEHLKRHEASHTGVKKFICETCGKGFTTKHMLDMHCSRHIEGPFKCLICSFKFRNEDELQTHVASHDLEHACHLCPKRFKREEVLIEHVQRHNSGHYSFKCEVCNKLFANKNNLNRHNLVHTNEKRFTCHLCNKKLASKYNLRMHLAMHSQDQQFQCEFCKKEFRKKHLLQKHNETPCV